MTYTTSLASEEKVHRQMEIFFCQWQWRDDRGWNNYSVSHSLIIEAAHQSGETDSSLSIMGCTLDLHSFKQTNEETGAICDVNRLFVESANDGMF